MRVLPKSAKSTGRFGSFNWTGYNVTAEFLLLNNCNFVLARWASNNHELVAWWTTLISPRRAERKDTWKVLFQRRGENGRICFSVLLLLSRAGNIVVLLLKTNVRSHKVVHSRTFPFPRRNCNSRYFSYLSNNFLRSAIDRPCHILNDYPITIVIDQTFTAISIKRSLVSYLNNSFKSH